ncbi:hypothetical protein L596_017795 [Steinernema carpocapsae]|uniref:Uncharacterized protein n=1 Tax=Steinernema carpocapsae TaxID=34508 RepID=A0A4U5N2P7_STECR|nr:hypothetical protein L596_017795 [Steinernema carpocapsae]
MPKPSEMDMDRRLVGIIYFSCSVALTPIYIKIIHVLLWHSDFRRLRCYQIMAQIGMIDCAFVSGYAVFGLTLTCHDEFRGFTHVVLQFLGAIWLTKCFLNVVLAMNRLSVLCEIGISCWLHWVSLQRAKTLKRRLSRATLVHLAPHGVCLLEALLALLGVEAPTLGALLLAQLRRVLPLLQAHRGFSERAHVLRAAALLRQLLLLHGHAPTLRPRRLRAAFRASFARALAAAGAEVQLRRLRAALCLAPALGLRRFFLLPSQVVRAVLSVLLASRVGFVFF